MPLPPEKLREIDASVENFFLLTADDVEEAALQAYIRANLETQRYEKIKPSFGVAQTTAVNWFRGYSDQLKNQGGGTIDGEFVPWMSEWKEDVRGKFTDTVETAIDEGWSTDQLSEEIQGILDVESSRGDRIARTEIARAQFWGHMDRARQAGYTQMRWITAPPHSGVDGPCDDCEALDDAVFDIDEFPEQPLHPNCRCTCRPVLSSLSFPGEKPPAPIKEVEEFVKAITPAPPAAVRAEILAKAKTAVSSGWLKETSQAIRVGNNLITERRISLSGYEGEGISLENERAGLSERLEKAVNDPEEYKRLRAVLLEVERRITENSIEKAKIVYEIKELESKLDKLKLQERLFKDAVAQSGRVVIIREAAKRPESTVPINIGNVSNITTSNVLPQSRIDEINQKVRDAMKQGFEFVSRIVVDAKIKATRPFNVQIANIGRSYYKPSMETIFLAKTAKVSSSVHEPGHHFERMNPEVHQKICEFIWDRLVKNDYKVVNLSTALSKMSGKQYSKGDEWVIKNFSPYEEDDPEEYKEDVIYAGKLYLDKGWIYRGKVMMKGRTYQGWNTGRDLRFCEDSPSSEVLSVGMELMYDNPQLFAERDPEFFDLVYGIITGG